MKITTLTRITVNKYKEPEMYQKLFEDTINWKIIDLNEDDNKNKIAIFEKISEEIII